MGGRRQDVAHLQLLLLPCGASAIQVPSSSFLDHLSPKIGLIMLLLAWVKFNGDNAQAANVCCMNYLLANHCTSSSLHAPFRP
jgi:hypothetical protein